MNPIWQDFLHSNRATFANKPTTLTPALYAITKLGILSVTGADSTLFLQGQLSCDIKNLTTENSFFSAFCNAKGQVISTLLIVKQADGFLIVLPHSLLSKVQKKLQMYIMRSKVQLKEVSSELCLVGLSEEHATDDNFSRQGDLIKIPQSRYLMINSAEAIINFCTKKLNEGLFFQKSDGWDYLDVSAGLAWLTPDSSEHYIPQMLNVEKWGGISFDKGCYTGQEVIARTHYLGKTKRELVVTDSKIATNTGNILQSETFNDTERCLAIMSIQS
ncbi:MAG: folate-binding protein YgfZ [Methylococcales bacterium]|nr:folate-binding protein YgfZ [Methylococcales bacterium]